MRDYRKRGIFHKNTGSQFLDGVCFSLGRKDGRAVIGQSDMVLEANRIIEESLRDSAPGRKGKKGRASAFLFPFLLGVIFTVGVALIFYLTVLLP